jgi:hypothetical protein
VVGFYVDKKGNLADTNYAHFHYVTHAHTHTYVYDTGFESRKGQETFHQILQTDGGTQLLSHLMGTGVISWRSKSRGVKFTTLFHVVQRLRMSGAIPLLHLYAFKAYRGTPLACVHVGLRQNSLHF